MNTIPHNYDELPCVLCAQELSQVLGISRAGAYNLLHSSDFPTLSIGKRLLVSKEDLLSWMKRNTNQRFSK